MSNWSAPPGPGSPSAPVQGGGGGIQAIIFRDALDASRTRQGFKIPAAEYPDGYLGTIQSRREDRLLNQLKKNLNQRNYQRGVHKGEKIDAADYLWPPGFGPMSGLDRQAMTGMRAAPLMTVGEQLIAGGGRPMARGAAGLAEVPPNTQEPSDLKRLSPSWK